MPDDLNDFLCRLRSPILDPFLNVKSRQLMDEFFDDQKTELRQRYYSVAVVELAHSYGFKSVGRLPEKHSEMKRNSYFHIKRTGGNAPNQKKLDRILASKSLPRILLKRDLVSEGRASAYTRLVNEAALALELGPISRCKIAWVETAIASGWFDAGTDRPRRLEIFADTLASVRDFSDRHTDLAPIEGMRFMRDFEALKFSEL